MAKDQTAMSTRIKDLRVSESMTQQDFAKVFKISKQTVSNYENNERTPDVSLLLDISNHFNVSMDYLTGNSEYKVPELKHIIDTINMDISLIESINKLSCDKKIFLHQLLADNRETLGNFLKSLMIYKEDYAFPQSEFLTGKLPEFQELVHGKAILKTIVSNSLDKLLEDISK